LGTINKAVLFRQWKDNRASRQNQLYHHLRDNPYRNVLFTGGTDKRSKDVDMVMFDGEYMLVT